jgi:hypothetical protein
MSVRVEKWKWPPGAPAAGLEIWWTARVLGRDEFGTWLFCPQGARHERVGGEASVLPCDAVQLLPAGEWWAAWWWADEHWVSVDVSTPPHWDGTAWRYLDLELDLALPADGTVEVVDSDEFGAAVADGRIGTEMAGRAAGACAALRRAMRDGAEPFGRTGWKWLAAARAEAGGGHPR